MKPKNFIQLFILFLILSGCAWRGGPPSLKAAPDRWPVQPTADLEMLMSLEKKKVDSYYSETTPYEQKRTLRNEIVKARIYAYNYNFGLFTADFYRESIFINTGTDWVRAALDGAATAIGGGVRALTAASGGLGAAKSSFAENVYVKKTMQATLNAMVAHRKEILVRIEKGLTKNIEEYPLEGALADLEEYYQAGTLPGAVIEISQKAGETAQKADEELKKILEGKYGPDQNSKLLSMFLEYDGNFQNEANKKRLEDWMRGFGLGPPADIQPLIQWEYYSSARAKIIEDLDLTRDIAQDHNTEILEKFLWAVDRFNKDRLSKLKDWMKQKNLEKVPVYELLFKEKYKSEREEAAVRFNPKGP